MGRDLTTYKLRVGGFNELSTIDSDGVAFSIYFQGCSIRCPGCHNPELQDFTGGTEYTIAEIIEKIKKHLDWYDAIVLLGGEPLDQPASSITTLVAELQALGKPVWLYTGYTEELIPPEIKRNCSVIVAGAYVEELKTGGFPTSSNQKVIDLRRT